MSLKRDQELPERWEQMPLLQSHQSSTRAQAGARRSDAALAVFAPGAAVEDVIAQLTAKRLTVEAVALDPIKRLNYRISRA